MNRDPVAGGQRHHEFAVHILPQDQGNHTVCVKVGHISSTWGKSCTRTEHADKREEASENVCRCLQDRGALLGQRSGGGYSLPPVARCHVFASPAEANPVYPLTRGTIRSLTSQPSSGFWARLWYFSWKAKAEQFMEASALINKENTICIHPSNLIMKISKTN